MVEITATKNDDGMRLSRFVLRNTHRLPHSLMYKSFRRKRIKVNGKNAKADTRLRPGDVVEMYLNDEFFEFPESMKTEFRTQPRLDDSRWRVVWQDARLAILYKTSGVLSHGDASSTPTLLGSYTNQLIDTGEYNPETANRFAPALCNRLDRGSEGLLICAKQYPALRDMNQLIHDDYLTRRYLCVTVGVPQQGTHEAYLSRNRGERTVTIHQQEKEDAKPIETGVRVLEESGGLALCEVVLYTGRTHQIRAHLADLGAPILGDVKYATGKQPVRYPRGSFALCANELEFLETIPEGHSLQDFAGRVFTASMAQLPDDWQKIKRADF